MKAKAIAYGAITIVNAIPSGLGAAMGIDLWTEAWVEFGEFNGIEVEIMDAVEEDKNLAKRVVEKVLQKTGLSGLGARVKTRSNIPIGKGLKSSSAAANAIALASVKALNLDLSPEEVILIGVEASMEAGVSITGAYDDSYTSFFGGINITDNISKRILRRFRAPEDLRVLIMVPEERLYTRDVDTKALRRIQEISKKAVAMALDGRFWEAMTINGLMIATILKINPRPIIEALRRGALAAGVSGTGPSIAAVLDENHLDEVRDLFESYGRVLEAGVNNRIAEALSI
ncbi:MAG: shikimate kinase [Thaumarchaeota archaeon]|nr:MAG: shikimate kinase [Nitrososphaerota archaeon]